MTLFDCWEIASKGVDSGSGPSMLVVLKMRGEKWIVGIRRETVRAGMVGAEVCVMWSRC
jgi:hypothetical protein